MYLYGLVESGGREGREKGGKAHGGGEKDLKRKGNPKSLQEE